MNMELLSEDAGVYLSAFISATIEHMGLLMDGKGTNKWNVPVNANVQKLAVISSPIQTNSGASYKIRFTINKQLRMTTVRLVGVSSGNENGVVDLLSQEIVNADFNEYNVTLGDNSISTRTNDIYSSKTKLSVSDGIVDKYIRAKDKTVWAVVSDIITESANYALSMSPACAGDMLLPNGILLAYAINQFGNWTCEMDFGEILLRSAKNDSIFI